VVHRAGCETVCNVSGPVEHCLCQNVHCQSCSSDFCSNCKNPWHSGLSCEQNTRRLTEEGHTDLMQPGSDLTKRCPKRNIPIEKNEGCALMKCWCWKHTFCWYCLASLDADALLRHDKSSCKKKLGHSRAKMICYRRVMITLVTVLGILLLVTSPLLRLAKLCIVWCSRRVAHRRKRWNGGV
jgi:hypothetical protein